MILVCRVSLAVIVFLYGTFSLQAFDFCIAHPLEVGGGEENRRKRAPIDLLSLFQ